jgi:hypothetical protein
MDTGAHEFFRRGDYAETLRRADVMPPPAHTSP